MSQSIIRRLLEQRLAAWAELQALRVAYENARFEPAAGATYLRCFVMPARTTSEDLAGDHTAYRGLFQVDVVCPRGIGVGALAEYAYGLQAEFPTNLQLRDGAFMVQQVTPLAAGPTLRDRIGCTLPMSFQYRADTV